MLKRKEFILGAAAGLSVAAVATAGGVIDWPQAHAGPIAGKSGQIIPSAGAAGAAFAPPQGAPRSFADIFQQVAPAVVQIDVEARVPRAQGRQLIPGLPFIIPNPEGENGAEGEGEGATTLGAGSGFFISRDGYIVTNNHVVENATEITVRLADERELKARLIGRDEATDLAVIKVEGADFPFVQFEERAEPRVGDWVIAVGNPFGLGGTATAGIVSGKGRRDLDSAYVDYLQIDAAINRGNSGGPTFDIYGRVIGVNSAILSPTGGSVGIGFAIPSSVARPVVEQLMRGQSVQRGYVGLGLYSLTPSMWEGLGQPRDFKGAYVGSVTPGGPADRAGAQVGDVILSVNGRAVATSTEATRAVAAAQPGETVRLEVLRDGRRLTLNVRAGARPSESELRSQDDGASEPSQPDAAQPGAVAVEGATVSAITPALRARYRLPEDQGGVVVTAVQAGSAAADLGLQPGFVVVRAGQQAISSPDELRAAVAAARAANRPSILLFVRTPTSQGTVPALLRFRSE